MIAYSRLLQKFKIADESSRCWRGFSCMNVFTKNSLHSHEFFVKRKPLQTPFHMKGVITNFYCLINIAPRREGRDQCALKQISLKQLKPSASFRCERWTCLQLDEGSFIFPSRQAWTLWPCRKVRFVPGGLWCMWRDIHCNGVTGNKSNVVRYLHLFYIF